MGPKLSVSMRVELDRNEVVDRAMNHVRCAYRFLEPAHAGSAPRHVHSTLVAWIFRARIISCESDPAARLRRPRSALPALPGFRLMVRKPAGPRGQGLPEGLSPVFRQQYRMAQTAGRIVPTDRRSS